MKAEEISSRDVVTDRSAVMKELQRLLRNPRFASSPQMSAFLSYVVTQTLNGNGNRIKAYTIGVDALGKPGSFDAQDDPSVRVLALRLRRALSSIYDSEQPSEVVIEIRLGSYVPDFYRVRTQPHNGLRVSNMSLAGMSIGQLKDNRLGRHEADTAIAFVRRAAVGESQS